MSRSSLLVEKKAPQPREQSVRQRPEVSAIFRTLSDDKSLTLFNTVALSLDEKPEKKKSKSKPKAEKSNESKKCFKKGTVPC